MIIKRTTKIGDMIHIKIAGVPELPRIKRAPKIKATSASAAKNNKKNSMLRLLFKLNEHFGEDCMYFTFSHGGEEPTILEAWQRLNKLKDGLRYDYKKAGAELKWIEITECKEHRLHHHILISGGVEFSKIKKRWSHGIMLRKPLDREGGFIGLAQYLMKESFNQIKEDSDENVQNKENYFSKKSFRSSQNTQIPEPEKEIVGSKELLADPKAEAGYYIVQDTVWKTENPVNGRLVLEYIMLKLDNKKHEIKEKCQEMAVDWWIRNNQLGETG